MDKKIVMRAGIVISIFVLIILASVGCTYLTRDKTVTPGITDGSDIYATFDGETVTRAELWDVMKRMDGYSFLIQYIDETILADYIDQVSPTEIADKLELLTYGTNDQETIDRIMEDTELNQDFIDQFRNKLTISGYDPDSTEDLEDYVILSIAKYNYARDYILNADSEDEFAITDLALQEYYEESKINDACVVPVLFNSSEEATLVFDEFNLVPNYNDGIGLYFGTTPITDTDLVFDETNTTQLNTTEIFEWYIKLYNYVTPWATQIPEDVTMENYCVDFADTAVYNYAEMTKDKTTGDPLYDLATYAFKSLSLTDTEKPRFSVNIQQIDEFSMLLFKVAQEELSPFADLTADEKSDLKDELVELLLVNTVVTELIDNLRNEKDLELFDPTMVLQFEYEFGDSFDNEGSDTLVASYGDMDITADQLFDYMEERVGVFYTVEISKIKLMLGSEIYDDIYGSNRDYFNNKSDAMKQHITDLSKFKADFQAGGLVYYGFSPDVYSYEEFLYLAFQGRDEEEALENGFIIGKIQPEFLYNKLLSYEANLVYAQEQYDNYLGLDAESLLIYLDFDFDFVADDNFDYVDGLAGADLTTYNELKVLFEDLVDDRLAVADTTFDDIVTEYQDSLIGDPANEWAPLKEYGFRIKTELLPDLSYSGISRLDETLKTRIVALYDRYNRSENIDLEQLVDSAVVSSTLGIHRLIALKGDNFEVPSAKFTETDPANPEYSVGSENDNDMPTKEQFELYAEIKFNVTVKQGTSNKTLPESVTEAIEFYFGDSFDKVFTSTGLSITGLEELLSSNVAFTDNNAANLDKLDKILDALYASTFREGYIQKRDLN